MTLIFARRRNQTSRCADCCTVVGSDTGPGEYYMVHDHVWAAAGMKRLCGCLCIGCLAQRLGRPLTGADFPAYPINTPDECWDTNRLDALKRIARHHHAIARRTP